VSWFSKSWYRDTLSFIVSVQFEFISAGSYSSLLGLKALHSLEIVHRDLHFGNLLWSDDGERLVIGDLECRWGQHSAPEIACDDGTDSGWTKMSDIYDVGICIQCIIYANVPATTQVEWPVPPPFDTVVEACTRSVPEERPTVDELLRMVDGIIETDH